MGEDDPEIMASYFKCIEDVKELVKYECPNERMRRWKEICDRFETLSLSSEKKKKFISVSELVLKSKFSVSSLQLLDSVSSDLKIQVKPFSLTKFAENLKIKLRHENGVVDFSKLAPVALSLFQQAPHFLYLRGTDFFVDLVIPEKRPRMKHAKDPEEKKSKPSAITNNKSDMPDNEIAVILNALRRAFEKNKNNPIVYWRLVIDPESFSRTIDNIFYASFLVRENMAKVFFDDEKVFMIEPVHDCRKEDRNKQIDQKQAIISLGHNVWKDLVQYYNIKKPMIKWK